MKISQPKNIVVQPKMRNMQYKTFLNEVKCKLMRVFPRESAASCIVGENIYMFGGRSRYILSALQFYDIKKRVWKNCINKGEKPVKGRYCHTMNG